MMMIIFTVNNPDFKAGVMALVNLLQIQRHDDYLVMLKVSFTVFRPPFFLLFPSGWYVCNSLWCRVTDNYDFLGTNRK